MVQLSGEQSTRTGRAPDVGDGGGAGHEGERGDEHFVPRFDTDQKESQMEGGGPAGQGHGVAHSHPSGQLLLEGVDVGSHRGDPVGVEGLEQHPPLLGAHLGGREVDPGHVGTSWSGWRAPAWRPAPPDSTPPRQVDQDGSRQRVQVDGDHRADGQNGLDADVGQAGRRAGPAPGHQSVVGMAPVAGLTRDRWPRTRRTMANATSATGTATRARRPRPRWLGHARPP